MESAFLEETSMYEIKLMGAILVYANLKNANLQKSYLMGADLQGADLSGVLLSDANLNKAKLANIMNWENIQDMNNTNISGIIDPPWEFIEFAKSKGAIEKEPE